MKIGYARVSTDDRNLDLQIAALKKAGCRRIYADGISGAATKRPELDKCLADLNAGDMLTVWKLGRLGRSFSHLVALLEDFEKRGVGSRSLTEAIDTGTASGRLLGHMIAVLAAMMIFGGLMGGVMTWLRRWGDGLITALRSGVAVGTISLGAHMLYVGG